jgi:hypothetical protein
MRSTLRLFNRIVPFMLLAQIARAQSAPLSFDGLPRANKDTSARPIATKRVVRVDTVKVATVDTVRVVRVDTVRAPAPQPASALAAPAPAKAAAVTFAPPSVSGLLQVQLTGGDAAIRGTYRIRRAEVKVVSDLGRKAQAILMIDPAKALSLTTSGTATSVTQSSRVLQDAILSAPVKGVQLDLGQQRLPLGYEGSHSSSLLETIDRALMESDRARGGSFGDVRDLGLAAKGKWRRLDYRAGVFNGSGETMNETDRNVGKAVVGQLALRVPGVRGLRVASSAATSGKPAGDKPVRDRVGAELLYQRGRIHLQSEAMRGQDGAIVRGGTYALAGYSPIPSLKLIARFDAWDPNLNSESVAADVTERDWLAGLTWLPPATRLKLQVAVVRKTYTRDITPSVTQVLSQLQASW